jgi:hypothetical protein
MMQGVSVACIMQLLYIDSSIRLHQMHFPPGKLLRLVLSITPSIQLQSFTVMSICWGATDFGKGSCSIGEILTRQ